MAINYNVYSNTGVGDPIDYSSIIDTTATLTYTAGALTFPGTWSFGVRAVDTVSTLEEANVDCVVTIVLDAAGRDITNSPSAPLGLRAFGTAAGGIRVEWTSPPATPAKQPTAFHVYTGTPTVSYGAPAATVQFSSGLVNSFVANLSGFTDGITYQIGVRAFNATAEEQNTGVVSVLVESTGPTAVLSLTAVATS